MTYMIMDNGVTRTATSNEVAEIKSRTLVQAIPTEVSMRQARLALLSVGMLADVETIIEDLPSPQKEAARIEWDYSSSVQRHSSIVTQLASALGLTDDQLDSLFIAASKL